MTFVGPDGVWEVLAAATGESVYRAEPGWRIHGVDNGANVVLEASESDDDCVSRLVHTAERAAVPLDLGRALQVDFSSTGDLVVAAAWVGPNLDIGVFHVADGQLAARIPNGDY